MKLPLIVVLVLACAGCEREMADEPNTAADVQAISVDAEVDLEPSADFETAKARAEEAIAKAEELGSVWTTSAQLLDAAAAAHATGNDIEATQLADEARIHAELAIQQAAREAATWQNNVIGE